MPNADTVKSTEHLPLGTSSIISVSIDCLNVAYMNRARRQGRSRLTSYLHGADGDLAAHGLVQTVHFSRKTSELLGETVPRFLIETTQDGLRRVIEIITTAAIKAVLSRNKCQTDKASQSALRALSREAFWDMLNV
jgi:hypothetical protein